MPRRERDTTNSIPRGPFTGLPIEGTFASHAVWKAAFVFHIPDAYQFLRCGTFNVCWSNFNAMYLHNIQPMDRIGILGIGLGHLAIQFAARIGCEAVVFSGTESKKEEAKSFGATEFYATKGASKTGNRKTYQVSARHYFASP
jgi:D-arabinose 1-dehydrogenase-like Zn-dependent alcohol dehydrogenase